MDVTCDRCKAEYEFDEALLGDKGTTVKCSACGHVFRVMPVNRDLSRKQLLLRHADGSVRPLASLRELQQRIRAGEVHLDDELGREGTPFRPLRDVPELKNFFISQPAREDHGEARQDGTVVAQLPEPRESADPTMAVAPESVAPGPFDDSEAPEAPTIPPPLPGTQERAAADARAAAKRAAQERTLAETARLAEQQRAANRTLSAPAAVPPESRPRSPAQGTMMGVGADGLQLPPPPRMPSVANVAPPKPVGGPPPAVLPPTRPLSQPARPAKATGSGTLPPSARSDTQPRSDAPSPHKTLYGLPGAPAQPPAQPPAYGTPASMPAGSTHPLANRASDRPPSSDAPPSQPPKASAPPVDKVELPKPPLDPDRFPSFRAVPPSSPPAAAAPVRKLYIDSNEPPPPRATQGSRALLYVALLLLIAGGGWFGMNQLRVAGAALEPQPLVANPGQVEVDASAPTEAPAPSTTTPFAPPIPAIEQEIARKTGEDPASPVEAAPALAKPDLDKRDPAGDTPVPNLVAPVQDPREDKAEPGKRAAAEKQADKPAAAEKPADRRAQADKASASDKPAGNDKLARAERAAAANPNDYGAQLNRADQLFARGDTSAAVGAYRAALALRPSGSEANSGLGFALLQSGKAGEALPYFDRAADSGYAEANIGLGDAYRALGQPSSAKEAYQAYLDRLPNGSRAEYARNWLDKLRGGGTREPAPAREAPVRDTSGPSEVYRPAGELTDPATSP